MLYLTRKLNESIMINDDVEISVVEIRGQSVKLGFKFPASVRVLRCELYERIQSENQAAIGVSDNVDDILLAGLIEKQEKPT